MQSRLWTALVNLTPVEGLKFEDLVEQEEHAAAGFAGAWVKVLVKGNTL